LVEKNKRRLYKTRELGKSYTVGRGIHIQKPSSSNSVEEAVNWLTQRLGVWSSLSKFESGFLKSPKSSHGLSTSWCPHSSLTTTFQPNTAPIAIHSSPAYFSQSHSSLAHYSPAHYSLAHRSSATALAAIRPCGKRKSFEWLCRLLGLRSILTLLHIMFGYVNCRFLGILTFLGETLRSHFTCISKMSWSFHKDKRNLILPLFS